MTLVVTGRSVLGALYANGGEATLDALPAQLGADEGTILRMIQSLSAARLISAPGPTPQRITLTEAGRKWCASELTPAAERQEKPAPAAQPVQAPARLPLMSEGRSTEIRPRPQERHYDRMRGVDVVRVKPRNPPKQLRMEIAAVVAEESLQRHQEAPTPPQNVPAQNAPARKAPPPAPVAEAKPAAAPVVEAKPVAAPVVKAKPVAPPPEPMVAPTEAAPPPAPEPVVEPVAARPAAEPEAPVGKPRQKRRTKSEPKAEEGPKFAVDSSGFVTHINGKKIF